VGSKLDAHSQPGEWVARREAVAQRFYQSLIGEVDPTDEGRYFDEFQSCRLCFNMTGIRFSRSYNGGFDSCITIAQGPMLAANRQLRDVFWIVRGIMTLSKSNSRETTPDDPA
jgi:hypothetical protein